jgi:hypothetical protein
LKCFFENEKEEEEKIPNPIKDINPKKKSLFSQMFIFYKNSGIYLWSFLLRKKKKQK